MQPKKTSDKVRKTIIHMDINDDNYSDEEEERKKG